MRQTISGKRYPLPGLVDVASRAGVSPATASRALNSLSTHPVSPDTRRRVLDAAAALEYRPNRSAQNLRTRHISSLAVMVHDVADPYFAEVVRGVTRAATEAGLLTVVCSSGRHPETELRYVEMLRQNRAEVVLFASGGLEDTAYKRSVGKHADAISDYGGVVVAMAPRTDRWPAEVADNTGGAMQAAAYILQLGHRRVALIKGPANLRTTREREIGYLAVLTKAGIEPLAAAADFTRDGGAHAALQLIASKQHFTAVLVFNDAMAIGALEQFRRLGIAVPGDVSVMGFDDVPGLEYIHPALSTVRVPMEQIGSAGVLRALSILERGDTQPRVRIHPVELIVRNSTAPPVGS